MVQWETTPRALRRDDESPDSGTQLYPEFRQGSGRGWHEVTKRRPGDEWTKGVGEPKKGSSGRRFVTVRGFRVESTSESTVTSVSDEGEDVEAL